MNDLVSRFKHSESSSEANSCRRIRYIGNTLLIVQIATETAQNDNTTEAQKQRATLRVLPKIFRLTRNSRL